ncbi:polysaccharide biosynthesis C-terminal domain-containing protein [Aerococcaceae bacterium DSM 111021]|nr:polysaccharide biosynthesis C-terminal domain-containing protein [Aerococcaceae bacterium DSM 111021]
MSSVNNLKLNTKISLLNQIVVLISGIILPRLILVHYGSETNGLVASVNQFLAIIIFLEMGVGSVVESALYRPINENDYSKINSIMTSAKQFFNRIALILVAYVGFLVILFPILVDSPYDYFGTVFLIIAMSISSFTQYYFGIVNQLFLNANEKNYIPLLVAVFTTTINIIITALLIVNGFSIQLVKLLTSLLFMLKPLYLFFYVKKNYVIDFNIKDTKNSLPQKWNGAAQHIAYTVMNSTDTILLTLFSTLENVSVYSVYFTIFNGLKLLITTISVGFKSFFGNLLVKNDLVEVNNYFTRIEWIIHTLVTIIFAMTSVLINSFISLYTAGINDVNYINPIFSTILIISNAIFCLRVPYNAMIFAGGHFKETQRSSFLEASINIVISLILIRRMDLIGVALGTLIATLYRTIYLVLYLSKNLTKRKISIFIKQICVNIIIFILIIITSTLLPKDSTTYFEWIINASLLGMISIAISLLVNFIFYKEIVVNLIKK